jgi:hypothetical protein
MTLLLQFPVGTNFSLELRFPGIWLREVPPSLAHQDVTTTHSLSQSRNTATAVPWENPKAIQTSCHEPAISLTQTASSEKKILGD